MSKIKKLAGETILYGLGSMVPRMLNFLLLPLHTKSVFSPEEYGVITYLFAYVGFLNVVYMFGMETTFFRFASKPGANQKTIFNQAQTIVLLISTLLTGLFIVCAKPIASSLEIPNHPQFITWLALVMLIDAAVAIPFAQLRLNQKPLIFSLGKIINVVILLGLNYYFLIYNKDNYDPSIGVGYVFLANLIANSFYILFLIKPLITWRPAFNMTMLRPMLLYAFPIMLTGVAGMTNELFSRITLQWWLPKNFYPGQSDDYALGIFGACYKYAMLMSLAVQAFRFAAEPFFFSNAADKKSPELFAKVNHYFIIVCCLLLLGVAINMDILKHITDEKYWEGLNVVPILLLAYLFLGVYYNLCVWFKLTDQTYYGTIISVGGAVITILGNYLLIPVAGYFGSSVATLVCYFLMMAACYAIGQKFYPIPYNVTKGLSYIIATMGIVYLVNSISIENQLIAFGFHTAIILLYMASAFFIEKDELKRALSPPAPKSPDSNK